MSLVANGVLENLFLSFLGRASRVRVWEFFGDHLLDTDDGVLTTSQSALELPSGSGYVALFDDYCVWSLGVSLVCVFKAPSVAVGYWMKSSAQL